MSDDLAATVTAEQRKNPVEKIINVYEGRLPNNIKDVFRLVRALVVGNEIVAPVISKLAETPITRIMVSSLDSESADKSTEDELKKILVKTLRTHNHLKGVSFDMYSYYNAFSSIYFAPKRYLICPICQQKAKKKKGYKYKWLASKIKWTIKTKTDTNKLIELEFEGICPQCKKSVRFIRKDIIYHNALSLRLVRWDPFYMDLDHYKALGRNEYYYRFPDSEYRRVIAGDRIMLSEYPWPYIKAVINKRLLKINQRGFYHFKLEGISGVYEGWGIPKILSVLTALYTVMSITKANEATSEGRINDLTIISPTPNRTGIQNEDPIGAFGLGNWVNQVAKTIKEFKRDKTLTALLPFPVTSESVYGQGRMQLVTTELQLYIRNVVAALGLPEDVIYSGGNYTSIAVAARILSNQADNARKAYDEFLEFIKDAISKSVTSLDYSNLKVGLEPYESPDDFQKMNVQIQAALSNRFPWTPIYKRWGYSLDDVQKMMLTETEAFGKVSKEQAKIEGRSVSEMAKVQEYYRARLAAEMVKWQMTEQGLTPGDSNKEAAAQQMATSIMSQYPQNMWDTLIQDIASKDPELAELVKIIIQQSGAQAPVDNGEPAPMLPQQQSGASAVANIGKQSQMPDKQAPRSEAKL